MTSSDKPRACAICAYPADHRCSGCGKAYYCSKEHQKTAWSKHKRLCKIYQAAGKGEPMPPSDSFCGLCGKSDGPFRKTSCCKRTVCDDYENYRMFSYSNDSCSRNHDRYTRCCYHHNEGHSGDDALECDECNSSHEGETDAWYLTNNFNFQDDIERAVPPAFAPSKCSKCGRAMKLNCEAHSYSREGKICQMCVGSFTAGVSPQNTYMMP